MWQPRIRKSAGSKFMGLVAALEEDIAAGLVAAGERMPPQRGVADALGIDLTTVTRAYGEAKIRGLLTASPGRGGTFVAPGADGRARLAGESPVDLSLNLPPQPARAELGARIARTIADVLRGGTLPVLQYVPALGTEADRLAGAAWLQETLAGDLAGRVGVTAGAQAALFGLCAGLLRPGDRLLAGRVTYPGARAAAERCGAVAIGLDMDEDGVLPDGFEAACRRHRPKVAYLVPTLDNPTTATLPEARRRAIVASARRHGVTILEDDPYRRLAADPPPALASIAPEICFHIATLAKCATPGLRLAYVLAPSPDELAALGETLRATTLMASPLLAATASRWISDGTLHRIGAALREENAARLALAARTLAGSSFRADPFGHHLWLLLPEGWSDRAFAAAAARSGVAIVPASAFAFGEGVGPAAVRLSLGAAPDRTTLSSGLRRLRDLLAGPPRGQDEAGAASDFAAPPSDYS